LKDTISVGERRDECGGNDSFEIYYEKYESFKVTLSLF
jgi:hypothetical protein